MRVLKLLAGAVSALVISHIGALSVSADTVTIGALQDATIYQDTVNNSNGAGPGIFAGTNGMNSPRRGLIEFDIAGKVPVGSTITNVQLTLFLGQVAGQDVGGNGGIATSTIGLYALLNSWGDGKTGSSATSIMGTGAGFPANPGDATWNARFFPGTLWTTAGGDHVSTASALLTVGTSVNSPYTWLSTPVLVNDVQGWLNHPSTNVGWELINSSETTPTDARVFFTREWSDPAERPQLQVTYAAPVPEPGAVWLLMSGLGAMVGIGIVRRGRSDGNPVS